MEIKPIAIIKTDFNSKFAIPRQSGRVHSTGTIIFQKEFQNPDCIKGLEQFSHLWLIWEFSENKEKAFNPTVRPPRLGGNKRIGVFASRSPFRPNNLGLSCVKLKQINKANNSYELIVEGADLMNNTPIYDIKPYIPYTDCIEDARGGYAEENKNYKLDVEISDTLLNKIPIEKRLTLLDILSEDPRPSYHNNEKRIYGFSFSDFEIKFKVESNILTVIYIEKA